MNTQEDYIIYRDILLSITELTEEQLLGTRRYPIPYYRAMIAKSLQELGHTTIEIGGCLKRDHSTICHCVAVLKDCLEVSSYRDIQHIYKIYLHKIEIMKQQRKQEFSELDKAADEYLGRYCNKKCDACPIEPTECNRIKDEFVFKAGAKAQKKILCSQIGRAVEIIRHTAMVYKEEEAQGLESIIAELEG